ncbi:MAG: L,D-transpeptidase [Cypionkella sp.]|nr:L,D-transpeptidase [Cypionkella sp.]
MTRYFPLLNSRRLLGILALSILAACGGASKPINTQMVHSGPVPGYEGMEDGGSYIEPVNPALLSADRRRAEVEYTGSEPAGSIVVDIYARKLYHVQEGGRAMRYAIAVGREGLSFTGTGTIQRKAEWPSWQPTANMIRTRPDLYAQYAGGLPGGADNPLGSRALYLYKGGRDTYFRIHGTIQNESIGRATSAGCIRMFNQDVIHLFEQVKLGTQVKVRSLAESLAAEGPYMDDAYGFAVPNTAENVDAMCRCRRKKRGKANGRRRRKGKGR